MNKSYEIGFNHGKSGNVMNSYNLGNRKVGSESSIQYTTGFQAGLLAHRNATHKPRVARATNNQSIETHMANHPNRGWRSRWSVNLETATASHRDGWVFKFSQTAGEPGAFDGECIEQPALLAPEHISQVARVAREAGDIYIEARNARH